MVISLKDGLKLISISIVCFCAVFVCTFFLNYYLDVLPLKDTIDSAFLPLYNAQIATAKMTCAITGGFLSVISVVILLFYVKLYIDQHSKIIGALKAIGYSDFSLAKNFCLFGLSVLLGCALGFGVGWIAMKWIYEELTIEGLPEITPTFHVGLLFALVILPTVFFTLISVCFALIKLKRPTIDLLKGNAIVKKSRKQTTQNKERKFLTEMAISTVKSKKFLAFFVTFSCFCFSAMVQMGFSMEELVEGAMGLLILLIGLILSFVSMLMAMTTLIKNNAKSIALMKTLGYTKKESFQGIFSLYIPFALLGFITGTIYQFGLLTFMINTIFKNVSEVPDYKFNFPIFGYTLLAFLFVYSLAFLLCSYFANKTSRKEIMTDN